MDLTPRQLLAKRLQLALNHLPIADAPQAEVLMQWFNQQPLSDDTVSSLVLDTSLASDFRRLTWYAAGPPQDHIEYAIAFLTNFGCEDATLRQFMTIGNETRPRIVGTWLQLTEQGLDGGWLFPDRVDLDSAMTVVWPSDDRQSVADWIDEFSRLDCSRLRRSIGQPQPMTELWIPLNDDSSGISLGEQLEAAIALFDPLNVQWFGSALEELFADLKVQSIGIVVALTQAGVSRLGLWIPEPSPELVLTLGHLASPDFSEETLSLYEGTLAVCGVSSLVINHSPEGLDVELHYWIP